MKTLGGRPARHKPVHKLRYNLKHRRDSVYLLALYIGVRQAGRPWIFEKRKERGQPVMSEISAGFREGFQTYLSEWHYASPH